MISQRSSGILMHPSSLPSRGGIGDFGPAAYEFVDWLAAAKQTLWQVLPLGPLGYGNSPYSCTSAFAGEHAADQRGAACRSGLAGSRASGSAARRRIAGRLRHRACSTSFRCCARRRATSCSRAKMLHAPTTPSAKRTRSGWKTTCYSACCVRRYGDQTWNGWPEK